MSNVTILPTSRKRKNPNWLLRLARLIGDYRYYRGRGFTVRAAWWNAKNTMYKDY